MKLEMSGYNATKIKYVTADVLKKVSDGNTKGYFETQIEWNEADDKIVVKFTNTTYINKALAGPEKKAVEEHENKHFTDFKKLAAAMKTSIETVLKAGGDAKIEDRIDWLIFDRCRSSAAFHRAAAGYSVEICSKPNSARPG